MKILELRFKNLNSLYGEWLIDFTDPEYLSNGIFALTGPTGAGKSTILDAICLALYGATPRLGRITGSTNEIMSRQTGDCYTEVLFESLAGRFRCHWEQHRARKKAENKLQDAEHQIIDANTGTPLETKKSLVSRIIEEKTGMDFDRFTRSVLLAQGSFDKFLKADIEQKSRILEQITGTGIYSEISRRVHERRRNEQERLNLLQAENSGIVILEPEQEEEIRQNLEETQKEETKLADKSTETENAIAWLNTINSLREEIDSLSDKKTALKNKIEAFKPERSKLEHALKAASLDGIYATLSSLRKQQRNDQTALKTSEDALPELENSAKTHIRDLETAGKLTRETKKNLDAEAPLIQEIRSLDQKIADQAKTISENSEHYAKEESEINTITQNRHKEQGKYTQAQKTLGDAEQYLQQNTQDEWLISGLAGIEEQFTNLLDRPKEITEKENHYRKAATAMKEASENLNNAKKQCIIHKEELDSSTRNLQQGKNTLSELLGNKLLREYRTEKDNLLRETASLKKIASLEQHRDILQNGQPCPLCGSTSHPFTTESPPAPDKTEQEIESLNKLITLAEKQEAAIKELEKTENTAHRNLDNSENLETNAANNKKNAENTLAELKNDLDRLQNSSEKLKLAISEKLQPLGIKQETEIPSLLETLKSRLNKWQEQTRKKTEIENQLTDINSEIEKLDTEIQTRKKLLTENREKLEQLKKEHTAEKNKRKELYSDKNPRDEENRLKKAIADAEESEKKISKRNNEQQQKLTVAEENIKSLKERIHQRTPELAKAETDLLTDLSRKGLADEQQFREARLKSEEREALEARAKELDQAQTELQATQTDRQTRLDTEKDRKITSKTLEELTPQLKKHKECLNKLRDTIASLKHKLNENTAARERIKEKQSAIENQKKECHRWEKLHSYIGSADGKKYRSFAQGITFEFMISHANQQLEKMTDRYLLTRDEQEPLELNVIDNYQAGEIRSTQNLSGGESFIVSLTLALGLSKMASRKVRVDSLFLDEGFGTLDEETLGTALDTLASLQQDNKLIGIISHIEALKNRISTQIDITPTSSGRSTLAGPGCQRIFQ